MIRPCPLTSRRLIDATPDDGFVLSTRSLLTCGMAAGPVFVAIYTAIGRLRAGYDPRREPVSALALGATGWTQTANFWMTGILTGCAAFGLRRALGTDPGVGRPAGGSRG